MTSLWTQVSLTIVLLGSQIVEPRIYSRFYDGGTQINTTYTTYNAHSRISCAQACTGYSGCWIFTWDKGMKQCQLLNAMPTVLSPIAASSTLQSYFASGVNGKYIMIAPGKGNWPFCKTNCESVGGHLYLPADTNFLLLLHQVFQEPRIAIGMYRESYDPKTVWRNMDGQIITSPNLTYWDVNQPDNGNGAEYYILSRLSGLADVPNSSINIACLCGIQMMP